MRVVPRSCTHCSYRDRSRARGLCPGLHGSVELPMWHRLMAAEDEPLSVGENDAALDRGASCLAGG